MEQSSLINKGKKMIILGFAIIGVLFVLYGRYQDPELFTPSAIDSIQRIENQDYNQMVNRTRLHAHSGL